MKRMRKMVRMSRSAVFSATTGVLTLLLFGAAGAPPARAQAGGGANAAKVQQLLQTRANMQAKNLGLTEDQTKQLVQINGNALKQIEELKANPPADRMEAAKALKSIMDTRKAALSNLLTPEQMKKFVETNQRDMASLMTLSLDSNLKLTNDQMKKLDKVNLTYVQKVQSALNMSNKVEIAKALSMAGNDHDTELQKTLTADQWKQYQAM